MRSIPPPWRYLLIGILCLAPSPARAAQIHDHLAIDLSHCNSEDRFAVILYMADQAPIRTLSADLESRSAPRQRRHAEIVEALRAAQTSQNDLLADLEVRKQTGSVSGFTSYWIANLIIAEMTKAALLELAQRDDIAWIEPNFVAEMIMPRADPGAPTTSGGRGEATGGLRVIQADRVWYELGITGAGRLVANCDSGVDGAHPALAARWRGAHGHPAGECWLDLLGGQPNFPYDAHGHGTHVMGTMTGLGIATGDTIGVAWNAQWIATNPILQELGTQFDNDVIRALEWLVDPDGDPETIADVPDVIENSWRVSEDYGHGYVDCDSRWWEVIDHCEAAGIVTVWVAGNEGPAPETIGSPADRALTLTDAFSVGAIDAFHSGFPYPLAYDSSRGPTGCNVPAERKIKPEVSAPGVSIYSSVPGGGYSNIYSGTSMAGPHVAGTVALMREANPDLDVNTIKEILMETAVDHGIPGEDNAYGWGVIDAYAAVQTVLRGLRGSVTSVMTGLPIPGATVEALELGRIATCGPDGIYHLTLPPGAYTVTATHPGYFSATLPDIVVPEAGTGIQHFTLCDSLCTSDCDPPETITLLAFDRRFGVIIEQGVAVFTLARDAHVHAELYDATGRPLRTLTSGWHPAGRHRLVWDGYDRMGHSQPAGVYLVKLVAGDQAVHTRLMLLR